jgi:predicted O-methyltransferase YrrM
MLPFTQSLVGWFRYFEYKTGIKPAHTQTSVKEQQCLQWFASGKKRLAEIGVYQGANTRRLREVMDPQGVIIAVDPYFRSLAGIKGYGWMRNIAHSEVAKCKKGSVVWIEDLGRNAATHPSIQRYLPIDFLFIDADHSWAGISGDWYTWCVLIENDGIVALHDSVNCNFDSARFTKEVIVPDKRFQLVETVDTLTVFRKLP